MTPWTVARQDPLFTAFSRPEYWSGLSFPSPGDLPDPRIKPWSYVLYCLSCRGSPYVCLVKVKSLSRVRLFATLWTVAHQPPLSTGFSRHEYRSGLSFPSPGDLPNPGMELMFLASPSVAGRFFTTKEFWEASGKPRTLYMGHFRTQ